MTQILNISRLGAVLLPCVLALAPTFAIAQAQPSAPAASAPPAGGMMGHGMMMDGDKMKAGMGMMNCNGKPCGPPAGAAGQMGGMPQSQGMATPGSADPAANPAAPAAQAPMKEHM